MSDTKQFVFKQPNGSLGTASTTENYYIYSITPTDESVDDSGTETLSIFDTDGSSDWAIQSLNNIEGINTPGGGAGSTENFAIGGPNYQNSGLRGLECDLDNRDPRIAYNAQLPATKCKAVVTGQYVPKLFLTHEPLGGFHTTPISFTLHYTEVGKSGGGNSDFTQTISSSDFNSTIVADSPLDGNGGATITFTSQGSGVTGGELTGHIGKKWQLDWTAPQSAGLWGQVNMRLEPIGNPGGAHEPHIFFKGTVVRSWEGNLFAIDGTGSDTIDPITVTSTVTATGILVHLAEASMTTTASIVDGSINKKIATAPTMATASTTAITTLFKLGDTLTFPSTTDFIGSIHPLISGTANLTSAFAFEDVPVVVNAGSSIETTFTTTIQGNIISDVTGDYTWNSLSNNPFVESGYVKGGYTDDAEYEWDDLLNTDGTADATWDTWTYTTWLGDETSWDNWPRDKWNSPFIMEINTDIPTATGTPKLAFGDTQAISAAFSLSDNAAFRKQADATLTPAFSCEGTAPGIFDTSANLTPTFTLAVSDIDYLENITSDEIEVFAGSFSVAATGNVKSDQVVTIDSALTFTLATAFVKYDIDETEPSTFTAVFTGNFKTDTDITLNALASSLLVGTLSLQPDPFNTITVQAETRTFVVPAENRQTLVMAENRVNTISNETRVTDIMQETRTHKIIRPGFTDRFSTPRVRSET